MAGDEQPARSWPDLVLPVGIALVALSVVFAFLGDRDVATAGFLVSGVFLLLANRFGQRLVKGKVGVGSAAVEFELAQEARGVTTGLASAPETALSPIEIGEHEEDDATRWLLADRLFEQLFLAPAPPLADCRFQLYLYDPDEGLLVPILRPGHPGPSPAFAPHQGTVGQAWATGEYVVATGPAVWDATFGLSDEQKRRYGDVTVVASVPVTNAAGRLIGVVSGSSTSDTSALATTDGLEAQIFLAEAAARVLVDLLKWFSDGYDDIGGRETPWSAR